MHRRLYRRSLLVLDRRPAGTPQEIFAAPTRHLEIARALVEPAGAAQPASPSMWALIQSYTQIQAELVATVQSPDTSRTARTSAWPTYG